MSLLTNILYVSEPSVAQEASLARAVSLAENNQAALTVIEVVPALSAGVIMPPGGPISTELQAAMVNERHKKLETLIEPYKTRLKIQLNVIVGSTFIEAIRTVLRNKHDLLMKPPENPDFIARLFGSDDMQLLRNCPCPVWLAHTAEKPEYASIVAAVNFQPDTPDEENHDLNKLISALSSSLALSDFTALHIVHAWDAPGEMIVSSFSDIPEKASMAYVEGIRSAHDAALQRLGADLKNKVGSEAYKHIAPRFHLRRGRASKVIPAMVEELQADLVVMGTVGRTGVTGLLIGNTAEAILEQIQCSVLAVKPPGFVSPVTLPK